MRVSIETRAPLMGPALAYNGPVAFRTDGRVR